VLALTPLLDERAVGALLDLRARGFDLVVIEVSPLPSSSRNRGSPASSRFASGSSYAKVAAAEYERAGRACHRMAGGNPADRDLEEVSASRRHARARARA
jgi:hypothetical protein